VPESIWDLVSCRYRVKNAKERDEAREEEREGEIDIFCRTKLSS